MTSDFANEPLNHTTLLTISAVKGWNSKVRCFPISSDTKGADYDPLLFSLPLFVLQILIAVIITRVVSFIIKPLRAPKIISEILGGVLLGPSFISRYDGFAAKVFPLRSMTVLETMGKVAMLYSLFLVGVEIDISVFKRISGNALIIGASSTVMPFVICWSFSTILGKPELIVLGAGLSATSFPVLARILTELKILDTRIGRVSLSAALVSDICSWTLLIIGSLLARNPSQEVGEDFIPAWEIIACHCGFVLGSFVLIRPAVKLIVKYTPEGERFNDFYICLIIAGVMICGFITDFTGSTSIFGAFVFGLVIPNGPLATAILEKLEDFVTALLLPIFFLVSGMRTNIWNLDNKPFNALWVVLLSSMAKFVTTFIISGIYDFPLREGLTLGLLLNTKGIMEMVVLNLGTEHGIIKDDVYTIMIIFIVVMTCCTTPMVMTVYKPGKRIKSNKHRTIQKLKMGMDLRILVCVHNGRNVPTIINLLEASNPRENSPIYVYALHLVELTGRASAMLIVHNARRSGHPAINRTQDQSERIINAFENFAQNKGNVNVQPLTAISSYSTMHEDICYIAEDKQATLIIVPFHKQQTIDGEMEANNPVFRNVNQNILANAPCSVAILIDRGLGGFANASGSHVSHDIAMLFFGGPDDREALAYAWRMAEQPGVNLTILRFLSSDDSLKSIASDKVPSVVTDNERDKQADDDYIGDFRLKTLNDETIVYKEKLVSNGEETVAVIRGIDSIHDLYIVGKGQGSVNPLIAGLTDYSEFPELGAIGDVLASSDFATSSVLVVQQYIGDGTAGTAPDSPADQSTHYYIERHMRSGYVP